MVLFQVKGPSYSYTPDGKLARRVWARGIATDYAYDNAGNLTRTEYDDNGVTPTITMSYDRVGNLVNATTAGVVTNLYAYDIYGHCTNEWQNDFHLTRFYDTLGRSTGYAINGTRQTTIAYDSYGRISTMTTPTGGVLCTGAAAAKRSLECCVPPAQGGSGLPTASNGGEFTWTYLPGSDLKASLQYPNGLTASWQYDANNQLIQVCNATPTNVISQFDYTYDAAGRRTAISKTGSAFGDLSGSIDSYTYNARSELTSARRTKNGQPIPGFSEDFDYDPIGNRRSSSTYNERGEAQTSTYEANNLNQYTYRTTPGYAAVRGEADPNATVTVNENPAFRLGSYYFGSDLFDNTAAGGLANLETYATLAQTAANGDESEDLVSATTNQVYIAQSPESFAYDDDGNQTLITTKTGLWLVTYNGENRPIRWVRDSDNTTLAMTYDHMGRRREKNDQRFFYDGYLQVADNCGNFFAWDCTEPIATRPLAWFRDDFFGYYYAHDGNKNVSEVISADGMLAAHYDYAPFGVTIAHCGKSAAINPWRFSCECVDDETENVYYMSRHYDPILGRWIARDPIGERGPSALYVFCENRNGCFDVLGMWSSVIIETHQNMVRKAATNVFPLYPRLNNLFGVVKDSIVGLISKGNCRMDSVYSADLALHYNRAYDKTEVQDLKVEQNNVEKAKRQYGKGLSERRKTIGKLLNIGDSYLSDTQCENVLLYIGEITHMVQDYYGHGVDSQYRFLGTVTINTGRNVMDIPLMSGSIGQYTGSSSNPTMKPSSYASATGYSEHGPIWWREPGYRAPDTKGRYDASVFETENELMKYMGKWCDKCCPYIERMQESVRAAYRSYAAAYGYEL